MISLIPGIQATSAALTAERTRLEVISQNIANANTTRGLDGKPYQRQQVVFESALRQAQLGTGSDGQTLAAGPSVSRIQGDSRSGRLIYQPGHPDADADGMVHQPNVNIHEEMADYLMASRSFEANLAVMKNGRSIALQCLNIGKR
ncbi:MAG: flagellar basal body rod protein FlgC [bacterium]